MRTLLVKLGQAALVLALVGVGTRALAEAPVTPPDSLERAAGLIRARAFEQADALLRRLLATDPTNRRAQELLAFALESRGDLAAERATRSALARDLPDDPRIQTDYGRVLERSGDDLAALRAYERARALDAGRTDPELDRAIERTRGRSAVEVATPVVTMSDPDARASSVQAGAALPFGPRARVTVFGSHWDAKARAGAAATQADVLALTLVGPHATGFEWAAGPRVEILSSRGGAPRDVDVGGALVARAPLGAMLEIDGRAEAEAPWDEAAVTMLHGGRTSGLEGHLYAHGFSRRLLVQAGARRRELSLLAGDAAAVRRPQAWQTLLLAGADVVVWRQPGASVRGEMLDEALTAPAAASPAVTLAYRHYDVSTRATPAFNAILGLAPRGSVDEVSASATLASRRRDVGLELSGGLAHDAARAAREWRAGGALIWAPLAGARFALRYDEASELAAGLVGRRRVGGVSVHVDL
jgi:hypothetical protein